MSLSTDKDTLRAALRKEFPREHGQLLPALHYLQHEFGYLPDWGMEVVGWHLGIPSSEVYGAATSYTELRLEEPGAHVLRICTGLGCWANGARELLEALTNELGTTPGVTMGNRRITFEETACGFLCGVSPAIEWDGVWKGRVSKESVLDLVREASSG